MSLTSNNKKNKITAPAANQHQFNNLMFLHSSCTGGRISKPKKTFCPKRLRKQLNNEEFKQFYFELVPNSSSDNTNSQQHVPPATIPITTSNKLIKKEPDANSPDDANKYMLMSFQFEASEQEKMRRAIHQCSSHFHVSTYMHHSKRKKAFKKENDGDSSTFSESPSTSYGSSTSSSNVTSHSPNTTTTSSNIYGNNTSNTSSSTTCVSIVDSTNSPPPHHPVVIQNKPGSYPSPHIINVYQQQQPTRIFSSLSTTNVTTATSTENCIALSTTSSSSNDDSRSASCMLSLDYEGIVDMLWDPKSPYCHLLKTPIYARHN